MAEKFGVIFPIFEKHEANIFNGVSDVFVKFTRMKFEKGMTLIFYVTGKKVLSGEAKIIKIEKLDSNLAWDLYGKRIFLNEDDYRTYIGISRVSRTKRKMKEIFVLILSNIKKYDPPYLCPFRITSSGCYLSKKKYNEIIKGEC